MYHRQTSSRMPAYDMNRRPRGEHDYPLSSRVFMIFSRSSSSYWHREIWKWCPRAADWVGCWRREPLSVAERTWVWCGNSQELAPGSFFQGWLLWKNRSLIWSWGDHWVLLQQDAQGGRHGNSGYSQVRHSLLQHETFLSSVMAKTGWFMHQTGSLLTWNTFMSSSTTGARKETNSLWSALNTCSRNCPNLMGKPKFFIVQACRGDRPDQGVEEEERNEAHGQVCWYRTWHLGWDMLAGQKEASRGPWRDSRGYWWRLQGQVEPKQFYSLILISYILRPTWEDMIIAYSTIPGYASLR